MDNKRKVIALGFFDGVHLGHGALLRIVGEWARELGGQPCALTFDRSPAAALTGKAVPLLSGVDDRRALMKELYGIQEVIVAPFDAKMRQMHWEDFLCYYLRNELNVGAVVVGEDFQFGYQGQGTAGRLLDVSLWHRMVCRVIRQVKLDGIAVSSTHIRTLVAAGEMEEAARFLGHPHILSGPVVHGNELGRTLGTPTANLQVPEGVIAPAFGVYASRVILPDGEIRMAVTNVGTRPTVNVDENAVTVEPWILDYSGDLYGRAIRVEFHKKLRDERKFASVDELRGAILENAEQTRKYFASEEQTPC